MTLSRWTTFQRTMFHWKVRAFRRGADRVFAEMIDGDQLSQEAREARALAKTRALVLHAFDTSDFYRRHYEAAGFTRADLADPAGLDRLPIVSRADITRHFEAFKSRGAPRRCFAPATTGGSTGTPLTVMHDARFPADAIWWRVAQWWGVHPADDMGVVYRLRRGFPATLVNQLAWWPSRRVYLDASLMTEASMQAFVGRVNRLKPAVLVGYVGAVLELASFLWQRGREMYPPKAVWVTSGPFTETQRQFMQTVFGAPVYDQYGTCEVMWLAAECRRRHGLHVIQDFRHVEFVDDANRPIAAGDWGRMLVTDLENWAFPLIRYEIGDIGRRLPGSCTCGVTMPLIDKVKGRVSDVVRIPQGGVVSGEYLTTLFDAQPDAVTAFQVYQGPDYAVTLRCVVAPGPDARRHVEEAKRAIQYRVGADVPVAVEFVESIPHERGKTRFIVSDAPKP